MNREPTPIIATRIPLALQAIFLASSRGETVGPPVGGQPTSLVFSRNWPTGNGKKNVSGGMRKSVSMKAFSINWEDDEDLMTETRTENRPSMLCTPRRKSTQTTTVDRWMSSTASSKKSNQINSIPPTSNRKHTSLAYKDSDIVSLAYRRAKPNFTNTPHSHTDESNVVHNKNLSISHTSDGIKNIASMMDVETWRSPQTTEQTASTCTTHSLLAGDVALPTPCSSSDDDDDTIDSFLPIHASDDDDGKNDICVTDHDDGTNDECFFGCAYHGGVNNKQTAIVSNRWHSSSSSSNISISFSSSSSPRNVTQAFPYDSDTMMKNNSLSPGRNYYKKNIPVVDQANNDDSCLSPSTPSRWDDDDSGLKMTNRDRWSSLPAPPTKVRHKKSVPSSDHYHSPTCITTNTGNKKNRHEVLPISVPLLQGMEQWFDPPTMKHHNTSPPRKPHRIRQDHPKLMYSDNNYESTRDRIRTNPNG